MHVGCLLQTWSPPTETERGSLLSQQQLGCPDCSSNSTAGSGGSKTASLHGWSRRVRLLGGYTGGGGCGGGRQHGEEEEGFHDGELFQDVIRSPSNDNESREFNRYQRHTKYSVENSGSSLDMARPNFSRQSSYCGSSFGGISSHRRSPLHRSGDKAAAAASPSSSSGQLPRLSPVRCLLSPDSSQDVLKQLQSCDLRLCDVDVHHEQKANREPSCATEGPPHLTQIVQQAQQEAAVDLMAQLYDGTLSRNLSLQQQQGGHGRLRGGHPNSSVSSSESGYNNGGDGGRSRSRKTSSVERTPSSGSTDGDSVFGGGGRSWWQKGVELLQQHSKGNPPAEQCNIVDSKGQQHYIPMSFIERQTVSSSKADGNNRRRRPKRICKLSHSLERGFLFDDAADDAADEDGQQQRNNCSPAEVFVGGRRQSEEDGGTTAALLWEAREMVSRERTHSAGESAPSSEQDSAADCHQLGVPSNSIVVCLSHPNQLYGNCSSCRSRLLPEEIFFNRSSLSRRQTVPDTLQGAEESDDDAASADARSADGSKYQNGGLPYAKSLPVFVPT